MKSTVTLNSFQGLFPSELKDAETPQASGQHDVKRKTSEKCLFGGFLF